MPRSRDNLERWTAASSDEFYGVRQWGGGYFSVSNEGHVVVTPDGKANGGQADLMAVVRALEAQRLAPPVLLRFPQILDSRIAELNETFARSIKDLGYRGRYRGVYPIKVNQQQQVVREVAEFGRRYHHGFEAGSKAELLAALSYISDEESLIICNGYKDREFVDLALYGRQAGLQTVLVVETPSELPLIIERANELGVPPSIGVRVKLAARAGGHWHDSGGDRSVFGLNTSQVMDVVSVLRGAGMLDCLHLLHYHLGSQIPNIRDVRSAVVEATRIYAGLQEQGAPMGILDLGGGLAVDYDGSHTNFESSSNYTLAEYCADVIENIMHVCDEGEMEHPTIVTESGRATVAYYSVLVFNVLDVSRFETHAIPDELPAESHEMLHRLWEVRESISRKNLQECFHDAVYYRDEIRQLFKHGLVSLQERALGEQMFWRLMTHVARETRRLKYVPDEFEGLDTALADIYYGNFSVFQSLPDVWAIEQLFPIMPIHRLNERPVREAILADITCDCDGKIDRFVDLKDIRHTLRLHELREDEEYYLGVFLVGAYQETLGDLHNLLGDTNVVTVRVAEDGTWELVGGIEGDSVADVLSYVEYDTDAVARNLQAVADRARSRAGVSPEQCERMREAFAHGLTGYTYFERD